MQKNITYYDVNTLEELPILKDKTKRYLEFIGGSKELRVFEVPNDMTRGEFCKEHSNKIENDLFKPIYENKGIKITPDMSYAVPGFYVISYTGYIHHNDEASDNLMIRTALIIKYLRKALRECLGIECCNLYSDEKKKRSNSLHFWFVPKYEKFLKNGLDHKLMDMNLNEYLKNFKYSEYKELILEANKKIEEYFIKNNIKEKDDNIYNLVSRSIIISITSKCNKKCKGCYNRFRNDDLKKDDWINFLNKLKEEGINKITLSGGDLLCRDDIFEILKYCLDNNFIVNIDTVGTILLEEDEKLQKRYNNTFSWDILKKINYIGIPLDGSTPYIINSFRNEDDSFYKKQLKIIKKLTSKGCSVSINTVLHKQNINDMQNIYNKIKKYKIKKWQIFQFMNIGPIANEHSEEFYIDTDEFNKIKKIIEDFTLNSKFTVNVKSKDSRYGHYVIIDSLGEAYKRENEEKDHVVVGDIFSEEGTNGIIDNYHFIG